MTTTRTLLRGRSRARLEVVVPGSKSVANRALLCAALASGSSVVRNVPDGDDSRAMVEGLKAFGYDVSESDLDVAISMASDASHSAHVVVNCGLAGTTSRFLTAFAATRVGSTVIDGDHRLRERPMQELHDALSTLGAQIEYLGEVGQLPIRVHPSAAVAHSVILRGDVSSQFISALMLIAPAIGGLNISLSSDLVSKPYVEMTARVMEEFGADVTLRDSQIVVTDNPYVATTVDVEPDFSSAAFAVALAVVSNVEVVVKGLAKSHLQGDSFILQIARDMGADVLTSNSDVVIRREPSVRLRPVTANLSDCSDLVPIVAVMALFADGDSSLTGIGFIREKESNRLDDLAQELQKTGARVRANSDGLVITGAQPLSGADLCVHNDHRLAMAFGVLGAVLPGVTLDDPSVVAKSWPQFWDSMKAVVECTVV